jgi:hypothetical protein
VVVRTEYSRFDSPMYFSSAFSFNNYFIMHFFLGLEP